jgi:hypothetical protein
VFGALCYPTNDREDLGKLKAKGDIGIFIGYSENSRAFRVYNRRTKRIMEAMNVKFDEISQMASERLALEPALNLMASNQIGLGPAQNLQTSGHITHSSTPPNETIWRYLYFLHKEMGFHGLLLVDLVYMDFKKDCLLN